MEDRLVDLPAHVFQIDTHQRDKWIPVAGPGAIPLEISKDPQIGKYVVLARDNTASEVLRCVLQGDLKFTPTSAKFGQWTQNLEEGIVYGIGFQSDSHLESFAKAFNQGMLRGKEIPQQPPVAAPKPTYGTPGNRPTQQQSDETLVQLKYENERLKVALGSSSANAKKWEQQLQTLKNNNARLRTALQESASNVDEWKKQLKVWKEESRTAKAEVTKLHQQLQDAEGKATNNSELQHLKDELAKARRERDEMQRQLASMQESRSVVEESSSELLKVERELQAQLQQLSDVRNRLGQIRFS